MPRWPDSESVWQQCIASAVRKHGDDASDHYHIAVDALLKGYTVFSSMTRYGLAAEAGILLARAGNIESALAITENQLRNTPAKWDAARVYAAAVAMLAHDDPAQAYAIVRRAARDAEPRSVYERDGPYPALDDLMDALEEEGQLELLPEVKAAVAPTAREAIERWQSYPERAMKQTAPAAIDLDAEEAPGLLAARGEFRAALEAAAVGENAYICIANLVTVARNAYRRSRTEICANALKKGLDVLEGSFGEEARQQLIYHEVWRFRAAHGLGMAAGTCLPEAMAQAFAQSALARGAEAVDEMAGGCLLVAAAEAAMPSRRSLHW